MIETAVRKTRGHTEDALAALPVGEPGSGSGLAVAERPSAPDLAAPTEPVHASALDAVWPTRAEVGALVVWPQPAALLDRDGAYLTAVQVEGPPVDGCWPLGEVDEPSALLTYLFGRGQHAVMLDLAAGQSTGWLATRWAGDHREWWLEPDEEPATA